MANAPLELTHDEHGPVLWIAPDDVEPLRAALLALQVPFTEAPDDPCCVSGAWASIRPDVSRLEAVGGLSVLRARLAAGS
jgi:hypothetical protein